MGKKVNYFSGCQHLSLDEITTTNIFLIIKLMTSEEIKTRRHQLESLEGIKVGFKPILQEEEKKTQ